MKYLNPFLIILIFAVIIGGCESKTETTLIVSNKDIIIPADGGSETFHITCNTSWSITTDNTDITVSPMSGNGDADITVSLPETWSVKEITIRLMISTTDGTMIENISITQKSRNLDGITLTVNNHGENIVFGGKSNDTDSIVILSNIPWQLKGPDWIEAYDGSRWVALSDSRAVIQSDNGKLGREDVVLLRTSSANSSERQRTGTLLLTPMYDGDVKTELPAIQLGKYDVLPDRILYMCNSLACNWHSGIGVNRFFIMAVEEEYRDFELTDALVSKWPEYTLDYIGSVGGLDAGKEYFFYTAALDDAGKYHINHTTIKTRSNKEQALSEIVNVNFDGNWLEWNTKMNEYCASYYQVILTNLLDAHDALLAWFIYYNSNDLPLSRYLEDGYFGLHTDYIDVQVITWGIPYGSNILSGLLGRHVTSFYSSPTRSLEPTGPNIQKISIEDIRKSIISFEIKK